VGGKFLLFRRRKLMATEKNITVEDAEKACRAAFDASKAADAAYDRAYDARSVALEKFIATVIALEKACAACDAAGATLEEAIAALEKARAEKGAR
jgi:hypothetical protein